MGIAGLLPSLKPVQKSIHLSELEPGTVVAIDTYCWLHKSTFHVAEQLLMHGMPAHIKTCKQYIDLLLHFKLVPILVFDGKSLPAKEMTDNLRKSTREMNRQIAISSLRNKRDVKKSILGTCIEIDHSIAHPLIQICQLRKIRCVVAPYEADAQLALLSKLNIATYVISEDSDLLVHGCKNIIFKLNLLNGCGTLIKHADIKSVFKFDGNFTDEKFRLMCILSGCDYLKSIKGIGLKKAYRIVNSFHTEGKPKDIIKFIPFSEHDISHEEIVEYKANFYNAYLTFCHQVVFNPITMEQQHLNPLPEESGTCSFLGEIENDAEMAINLAIGNIHPDTKNAMSNFKLTEFGSLVPKENLDPKTNRLSSASPNEIFSSSSNFEDSCEMMFSDNTPPPPNHATRSESPSQRKPLVESSSLNSNSSAASSDPKSNNAITSEYFKNRDDLQEQENIRRRLFKREIPTNNNLQCEKQFKAPKFLDKYRRNAS